MKILKLIIWVMSAIVIMIPCTQAIDELVLNQSLLNTMLINMGAVVVWIIFLFLNPNNK